MVIQRRWSERTKRLGTKRARINVQEKKGNLHEEEEKVRRRIGLKRMTPEPGSGLHAARKCSHQ